MGQPKTYPHGVPSWVETAQPDIAAAQRFYGDLFGWTYQAPAPEYTIVQLDGRDVGGMTATDDTAAWHTYVAVDDAEATAAAVAKAGGTVLDGPSQGPAGVAAACADPAGGRFRLWQAGYRLGAQAVNEPGSWNFSDLHTPAVAEATDFYSTVFGWQVDDIGFGLMVRRPGYGDHLAATTDPDIRERQASVNAPPGFADAIAWFVPRDPGTPAHWHVTFTVVDRDATVEAVRRGGGEVVSTDDNEWTRLAVIRDPWGATFTASQFAPGG